jgi:hypothetical protein
MFLLQVVWTCLEETTAAEITRFTFLIEPIRYEIASFVVIRALLLGVAEALRLESCTILLVSVTEYYLVRECTSGRLRISWLVTLQTKNETCVMHTAVNQCR